MKILITSLMVFSVMYCGAQTPLKSFYLKRSLKQDGLSYHFTVLDEDKHGVWFYHRDRFYYWCKAQHVISTQGASSGRLLHGQLEAFYQNGQLNSRGNFNRGLKNGEWSYWREDGTLLKTEHYRHGQLIGTQSMYDDFGHLTETIRIKKSRSQRRTSDSLIIVKGNHRTQITVFDSLGQIESYQEYKDLKLHGRSKLYVNGELKESKRYKHGEAVIKDKKNGSIKERLKLFFTKKNIPETSEEDPQNPEKPNKKKREKKKPKKSSETEQ